MFIVRGGKPEDKYTGESQSELRKNCARYDRAICYLTPDLCCTTRSFCSIFLCWFYEGLPQNIDPGKYFMFHKDA